MTIYYIEICVSLKECENQTRTCNLIWNEYKLRVHLPGGRNKNAYDFILFCYLRVSGNWVNALMLFQDGRTALDISLCYGKDFKSYDIAKLLKLVPANRYWRALYGHFTAWGGKGKLFFNVKNFSFKWNILRLYSWYRKW